MLGLTDQTIEFALIGLALVAGLALGLLIMTALDRERRNRVQRLTGVVMRAAPTSKAAVEAVRISRTDQKKGGLSNLLPKRSALVRRLGRAGLTPEPKRYVIACVLVGIGSAIGLAFAGLPPAIFAVGGVAGALLLPHLWLSARIGRREIQFIGELPEGIDIVVRGLKAGLPVSEALNAIGRESPEPVGGVFREIGDLVRIGHTIEDAISKAAIHMAVPELRYLGITLAIQKETGGNLTETLENLSDILRKRRQMKLKIRAVSSEARASAYIIGSLPFCVSGAIYVFNRDYVITLFTDPRGIIMVVVGLCSIAMGAAVMMKLVKFDI